MIELAVIGGGPAGLTAALYAARAGRSVAVFEGSGFGGQITLSPLVENYPGLGAVSGMELGDRMYAQAEAAGAELTFSGVQRIERNTGGMFLLETEDGAIVGPGGDLCRWGKAPGRWVCPVKKNWWAAASAIAPCAMARSLTDRT